MNGQPGTQQSGRGEKGMRNMGSLMLLLMTTPLSPYLYPAQAGSKVRPGFVSDLPFSWL